MKILFVHNFYQQPGGEDAVFTAESTLLEAHGHEVIRFTVHNDEIANLSSISLASKTIWNQDIYNQLRKIIQRCKPNIAHFHNTFPLISPSAHYAAKAEGVPVVQTLHNYRLFCPNAEFFRQGSICEDCLGKFIPLPAVYHACYREDRLATGVMATFLTTHRLLKTWDKAVDLYIALTDFSRDKFIQSGLSPEKIIIKPNFVAPTSQPGAGDGGYALFVGRLAPEKGIGTLLTAWKHLNLAYPLKIVGDGPLAKQVSEAAKQIPSIEWLGRRSPSEVYELMGQAVFLVFPSEWYEGLPRTVIEAFAKGTPVIASKIGSLTGLIEHGRTGFHFRPGDAQNLAAIIEWALAHPIDISTMRQAAREEFLAKYTSEVNYQQLIEIYTLLSKKAHSQNAVIAV